MTLTIPSFIYFILVCLVFFIVREAFRTKVLVFASLLYVFYLSPSAAAVLLAVSVITWLGGMLEGRLARTNRRRSAFAVSCFCIVLAVLSLLVFKYIHLFPAAERVPFLSGVIMPVGYSFYIFQVISYLVDIVAFRAEPDSNWLDVLLYLCWFPKYVSGPIERKDSFDSQLKNAEIVFFSDPARWKKTIGYILVGCFYKVVVANRLGIYVDTIFEHSEGFSSTWLLIGILLYSFQIYCDFAGYSYAAIGISMAFGIELTQNFMMPYCSSNITEFWRRWHRSLSNWLRDYLYIPLGGSRRGETVKILNTFLVFLVCGMWHGAGTGFIVWGILHGVYSAVDGILNKRHVRFIREGVLGRLLTFSAVSFAWIFFRASSAKAAFQYIRTFLKIGPRLHTFWVEFEALGLNNVEAGIIIVLVIIIVIFDIAAYRRNCAVPDIFHEKHYLIRYSAVFILLMVIIILGIYGPNYDSSQMIYMQF